MRNGRQLLALPQHLFAAIGRPKPDCARPQWRSVLRRKGSVALNLARSSPTGRLEFNIPLSWTGIDLFILGASRAGLQCCWRPYSRALTLWQPT